MLKILQARLQQYMNHELPDVQAGFRKDRGSRDQIANIRWIIKKAREFQKNTYLCFLDYIKDFDCVDRNKLWKILQEMGISDHLSCLLRNLYAGQEATVTRGGCVPGICVPEACARGCPTLCDLMGCKPARFLCPWNSPGKNTGVGGRFLLLSPAPVQASLLVPMSQPDR